MRRVQQDLSALFGSMGYPAASIISIFMSWGCSALAYQYYPLATNAGYAGAVAGAFVSSLPVFFLAYWLGAAVLPFVVDAKRSCLPGSQRLARSAKFLASALLLPALVFPIAALAASPVWRAWVPTVLVLVIALALLAVAKWRRVIRQDSRAQSLAGRLRTICIRIVQRGALERAPRWAVSRHGSSARQPAVQIIRTCLGGMLARRSTRQLTIGTLLLGLLIVTAIGPPWLGASGWRWAVGILALTAAGFVPSGFLTQISKVTRSQIAELALMPGLGAPAAQRRALCSAVLAPPLLWLSIVLLLGSASLVLKGEPLSSVGVLAACIFVNWLIYTLSALRKLATFPQRLPRSFYAFHLYFWVYYVYFILSIQHDDNLFWLTWYWFGWISITAVVLVSALIATVIGYSVRRLATAPHPFLS